MEWFVALLFGIPLGIGITFAFAAAYLNRSNNLGDETRKAREFSSSVTFLDNRGNTTQYNLGAFQQVVKDDMETLRQSPEYIERVDKTISTDLQAPVERYFPSEEE